MRHRRRLLRRLVLFSSACIVLAACASLQVIRPTLAPTSAPTIASPTAAPTPGHLPQVDWLAYHDEVAGFTIQFPLTWQRQNPSGYPVVYSLPAAPGTTLLEKRMEINVVPDAGQCRESTYAGASGSPSQTVAINGVDFLKETGGGIAAGNFYDWTAYSTLRGSTCVTITFVLHSASSGVYSTEPAAFDKETESEIFPQLLNTFKFDP